MPRKSKAPTGTVEFVNKPTEEVSAPTPAPSPSILAEPPKVDIPEQGTPTTAPAPPAAPAPKVKRAYKKKNEEYWTAMKGSRKELIKAIAKAEPIKETKNEVVVPPEPVPEKKKPGRPKKEKAPPTPKPIKPPKPVKEKPVKAPKPPPAPKKVRVYEPSSDEDDEEDDYESEEESESEEEPEVEVVAKKATKRLKTLEKIDKRIRALSNPYSASGRFSVF